MLTICDTSGKQWNEQERKGGFADGASALRAIAAKTNESYMQRFKLC